MIDQLTKDAWYVDIRGQIRGPYNSWQIIQELISGNIKVIHRVTKDNMNWKAICNDPHFENAIELCLQDYAQKVEGQANSDSEEIQDESSGFHNLSQISKGISAQLDQAQNLQELNVGLNALRKLKADILHNRKTVIEAKQTVKDELHPEDRHIYVGMDTGEKLSIFARHKLLFSIAIGGMVVMGGLKYLDYREKQAIAELEAKAKELQKEKMLDGYDKVVDGNKEMSSAELITLAEEQIEKDNLPMGEQLLKRALEVAKVGFDKSKAHSLLGYISSQNEDFTNAKKSYEESLKGGKKLYLAQHNYAVLKLKTGQLAPAEAMFLSALEVKDAPRDKAATIFGLLEVAMLLDKRENAEAREKAQDNVKFSPQYSRTDRAAVVLERVSDSYLREKLLAKLYMEHMRGEKKLSSKWLLGFLKVDDSTLKERSIQPGLDVSRLKWANLYSWCLPIYNRDRKSIQLNALFAYCVWKGRGAQAALPYINYASEKAKHDPIYKKYAENIQKDLKGATR